MNQNMVSLSHGELHWTDSLPPAFKAVRLPGSTISTSLGEFGSVCIQEFSTDDFFVRFNVFDLLQRFVARSFISSNGLFARQIVKGRCDMQLNDRSVIPLRQNQFMVIENDDLIPFNTFEKNIHITFDTFLSAKFTREIQQLFPDLEPGSAVKWAGAETTETIHSILHCKYENELRRHFFESRIKDLFFKYLFLIAKKDTYEIMATEDELKAVYHAEELISKNIREHYSIPQLSKQVLLNEFRLKLLFKKIFGIGPYEYLVRKRLEKAKELLEAGLSIKEVAAQVGYRPSDFTTAFRNHFGSPPSLSKKRNS